MLLMSLSQLAIFFGYLFIILVLFGIALYRHFMKKDRRYPFSQDVKAIRRPGESLSVKLVSINRQFWLWVLAMIFTPVFGLGIPLWIGRWSGLELLAGPALAASVSLALACFLICIRFLLKKGDQLMNYELGLFGERIVADQLSELISKGYQVYHDIQCQGGGGLFNLDHVVIGRGQVIVVETKTYRKPKGLSAKDLKISYEGDKLCLPHRHSSSVIKQAQNNARWLREELKKKLDLVVVVRPVLTFPGWYVNSNSPKAPVLISSTKQMPEYIQQRFTSEPLTPEQEMLVCKHLSSLCQDVTIFSMPEGL
jgi:hypothetical protein